MRPYALHILLAIGLLASGCDREAIAASDSSHDVAQAVRWTAQACGDEFVVPHGFTMGWKRFNHRVSKWGVGLDQQNCSAKSVDVTHVGGVFSKNPIIDDTPNVKFAYQRARVRSDVAIARVSVRDIIPSSGHVKGSARFSPEELGLAGFERYTALIEGVHFDTGIPQTQEYPSLYNPRRGYTTRGLGARVDITPEDGELVVGYEASFVPGTTPERVFMNSAIPFARIGAGLDVLIIASNGVPVKRGSVTYQMEHERPEPLEDVRLPAADERVRTVAVAGDAGAPRGFWGLQSFQFDMDLRTPCDTDDDCTLGTCDTGQCDVGIGKLGEYIREFSVGVSLKEFDEGSGTAQFIVDGYTSNASSLLAYYPLRYDFKGGFAWLQADGVYDEHQVASDFETGSASFRLR